MKAKTRAKKARRDWLKKVHGHESACGGKRGYEDRAEAVAAIARMRAGLNFRMKPGFILTAYVCAGCGRWKVGNQPVPVPRVRGGRRKAG